MIADNEALGPSITVSIGDADEASPLDCYGEDEGTWIAPFADGPAKFSPEFEALIKKLFDV